MARRNEVPESVSAEAPKAKRAEKARRERVAAERRERDRPSVSARDPRNVRLSKEHLEQLREEVTPTDAAGHAYGQSGNVVMAGLTGAVKAAETYGAAKLGSPQTKTKAAPAKKIEGIRHVGDPGFQTEIRDYMYTTRPDVIEFPPERPALFHGSTGSESFSGPIKTKRTEFSGFVRGVGTSFTTDPAVADRYATELTDSIAPEDPMASRLLKTEGVRSGNVRPGVRLYDGLQPIGKFMESLTDVERQRLHDVWNTQPPHYRVPLDKVIAKSSTLADFLEQSWVPKHRLSRFVTDVARARGYDGISYAGKGLKSRSSDGHENEVLLFAPERTFDETGRAILHRDRYMTAQSAKGGDTRSDAKGGNSRKVPFDPERDRLKVPKGREREFEAYMDSIANLDTSTHRNALVPKDWRTNTAYNRDYDFVAAFLADKARPVKMDDGYWHMGDVGKMPNHPTFSIESYYAKDPRWAPYAGRWEGERFIPPTGSEVRQDAKGGDTGPAEDESIPEPGGASVSSSAGGGPRIVINPSTFRNEKDALCVAFNERFRIAMEQYSFEPQSEPTDRQRRFFADTAYADDEVQLRRTILARILTLDTSVKDPTDEQLREAVAFLQEFKRRERPSNDWEASAIDRLEVLVQTVVNKGRRAAPRPKGGTVRAAIGGGTTEDDERERQQTQEPEEPADTQEPVEGADAEAGNDPNAAGQTITNNDVVMSDEEAQRTADEFKRDLLGGADNAQDAAITDELEESAAGRQQPQQPQQPQQTAPAAETEDERNRVGRWLTKNQRRLRRYLRALYGKDYAYAMV